jgi:TatD DNase family protein
LVASRGKEDDARSVDLRCVEVVSLRNDEPEPRLEELRGVSLPKIDLDACILSLRKDRVRAGPQGRGEGAGSQDSAIVEERSEVLFGRRIHDSAILPHGTGLRRHVCARAVFSRSVTLPPCLVDTHCHLEPQYFPNGADEVVARAEASGVRGFVVIGVGEDLSPARDAVALAARMPRVGAAVGVHPHDALTWTQALHDELASLAAKPEVVAIGEIGLDYHYERSPRDAQRAVFVRLVALAKTLGKPIVIHTREAAADTLDVLEAEGARDVGGVIHCFSEDKAFATRALDLGFDLSFSGIVTFKNARSVQEVAEWAPIDRILVETDSPYLAPVPLRGKPCEPAYIVHTARRVAELRGTTLEAVAAATTANAERRFRMAFVG